MKIEQVLEARYHGKHPIVQWAIDVRESDEYMSIKDIPNNQVDIVIRDLSSVFGEPDFYDDTDKKDVMVWDRNKEWLWTEDHPVEMMVNQLYFPDQRITTKIQIVQHGQ